MAQKNLQRTFFTNDEYVIRHASSTDEFKDVWWDFMRGLGWNRSYYDLDSWVNPSQSYGMILLIDKTNNVPVGHVGAIIHSNKTGWISAFVIDKKHRGKGTGRELFKAALMDAKEHDCHFLGLDAVAEQKATYERRGFIESHLGTVQLMSRPLAANEPVNGASNFATDDAHVVDLSKVPQQLLVQHELQYTDRIFRVGLYYPRWYQNALRTFLHGRSYAAAQVAFAAEMVLKVAMESSTPEGIKDTPLPEEPSSEESCKSATLAAEVWSGNKDAVQLFKMLGWKSIGLEYHRMWVDSKCTPEQADGGLAQQGVFAMFDAGSG